MSLHENCKYQRHQYNFKHEYRKNIKLLTNEDQFFSLVFRSCSTILFNNVVQNITPQEDIWITDSVIED